MTGLEMLKEEMLKQGASKSQVNSQTLILAVAVLAQNEEYITLFEKEKELGSIQFQINNIIREIQDAKDDLKRWKEELQKIKSESTDVFDESIGRIMKIRKEAQQYIDDFYETIEKCETPQERDKLKVAQMFVNSVTIDTKYDNTAFIIGLASILSGGNVSAINELRKINPKIPEINWWTTVINK